MAKYKAYVSAPLDAGYLKKLEAICDVTYCGWSIHEGLIYGEDESIEAFHEADIIITNYDLISRRVMEACPDLKLIACCRGNPVNVDRAAATALGDRHLVAAPAGDPQAGSHGPADTAADDHRRRCDQRQAGA